MYNRLSRITKSYLQMWFIISIEYIVDIVRLSRRITQVLVVYIAHAYSKSTKLLIIQTNIFIINTICDVLAKRYDKYEWLYSFTLSCGNRTLQLVRFVAPFQTTWCSLEIYSFVSFKINYSYARKYLRIWKQWFSRVPTRGLKWGNKTYKLKRSIYNKKKHKTGIVTLYSLQCFSCAKETNILTLIDYLRLRSCYSEAFLRIFLSTDYEVYLQPTTVASVMCVMLF